MEAIGNEVFIALIIPVLGLVALIVLAWPTISNYFRNSLAPRDFEETEEARLRREQLADDSMCSICLGEPKKLKVSSTCGHSFCGKCLFDMFTVVNSKIKCPLCRQDVTTIFKLFVDTEPADQVQLIVTKIKDYNRLFDDNRSMLRKIFELPYVLRRLRMVVFRFEFIGHFIASVKIIWVMVMIVIYTLSPFDLLPEAVLGMVGYIDDLIFSICVILFFIMVVGLEYSRNRP